MKKKDYVFNDQNKFDLLKDLKLLIITDFFNLRKTTSLKFRFRSCFGFQVNTPFAETSCGECCSCRWESFGFELGKKTHNFCCH